MSRTIPGHVDSTGKLLERLALVAKEPVLQKGKVVRTPPVNLYVSPSVLRQFICTTGCTACCLPFTLDFTPEEFDTMPWKDEIIGQAIEQFSKRHIEVNGNQIPVYTFEQFREPACPYLRPTREGGALGCGFWTEDNSTQPLECAAAPQLLMTTRGEGNTVIMKRPFGRGWAWQDKPQCYFDPVVDHIDKIPDTYDFNDETMLLRRYDHWAAHLGIETWIPEIIAVLEDMPMILRDQGIKMIPVI